MTTVWVMNECNKIMALVMEVSVELSINRKVRSFNNISLILKGFIIFQQSLLIINLKYPKCLFQYPHSMLFDFL